MMFQLHGTTDPVGLPGMSPGGTKGKPGSGKNQGSRGGGGDLESVSGLGFAGRMKLYCLGVPLLGKLCGCCRTKAHDQQLKVIAAHGKLLTTQLDLSRILRRQKRFRYFLNLVLQRLEMTGAVNKG